MDCWLNRLPYSIACFDHQLQVFFFWHDFSDPVKFMSSVLAPLSGLGVVECCLEYWISQEGLANVLYHQFGVLWGQVRSNKPPNWASGFLFSSCSIFYSHVNPTHHPYKLPRAILLPPQKNLSKTGYTLGIVERYTPLQLLLVNR